MIERRLIDDCFLHDKDRLSHTETLAIILDRLAGVVETERLPLQSAAGRYLVAPVTAPRNVPLHDNAAVDGYAYDHASLPGDGTLTVGPRIAAGDTANHLLKTGEAARIFTGAMMPNGADTVAMQEDCSLSADSTRVTVPTALKRRANCRRAGEDVVEGEKILAAGMRLRPQDIAALASFGFGEVKTFKPVRIALISTGNELRQPGNEIEPGEVYDSNRVMLATLAATLPVTITDLGIVPDEAAAVERAIADAAKTHDVILTTGGASRGEEDHVITAIDTLGTRHLWQIAIKPGRPMSFGQIGDCVFLGLPGNPVAAFVCFLLYARPALTILGGGRWHEPQRFEVPAGFSIALKKPDRREFLRGWLETAADGTTVAQKFARDGSGLISGLSKASGLIELDETTTSLSAGEPVRFIPFSEFGLQ